MKTPDQNDFEIWHNSSSRQFVAAYRFRVQGGGKVNVLLQLIMSV